MSIGIESYNHYCVLFFLKISPQKPITAEAFDQVTQLPMPEGAHVLKQVCRPVVKIQQALESIEKDLADCEQDENAFAKVIFVAFAMKFNLTYIFWF